MKQTVPYDHPRALEAGGQRHAGGTASLLRVDSLLDTNDVAALLKVQPSTIRKWVHMQSIPVVRWGVQ